MLSFGNLAVLLTLVVALSHSGSAAEKLASCCTTVDKRPIKEPIIDFLVQKPNKPCVKAVIFQTASGLYCKQINAPWVLRTIQAFRQDKLNKAKAKAEAVLPSATPSPKVSLLSVITSTVGPLSHRSTAESHSSTVPASSSSSSEQQYK